MTSLYKPTGYKPGRPRKGEVRPVSLHAVAMSKYRERRHIREPEWRDKLSEAQSNWCAANCERAREISRSAYKRKKAWDNAKEFKAAGSTAISNPLELTVGTDNLFKVNK